MEQMEDSLDREVHPMLQSNDGQALLNGCAGGVVSVTLLDAARQILRRGGTP